MKCTSTPVESIYHDNYWFVSLATRRQSTIRANFGMKVMRKLVTSLLLLVLPFTEACNKKKPSLPLQAQAQAPTIPPTLPEEIPEKTEPPPPEPQPRPNGTQQPKKQSTKPAKAGGKKSTPPATTVAAAASPPPAPAPAPAQTPPAQSTQTVASLRAPHSNTTEPAPEMTVAAAIPSDKANKQREDTARMVDATENALKSITRQLNDEEKSMRTQIETYLQQSRKATADGDYERAFNLAKKAQVLSEALLKP